MAAGGMDVGDIWGKSVMLQPGQAPAMDGGGAEPPKPPEAEKDKAAEMEKEPEKEPEPKPPRLRELGLQDRQAGCQTGRHLFHQLKWREWGTQDSSSTLPDTPKATPIKSPSKPSLKTASKTNLKSPSKASLKSPSKTNIRSPSKIELKTAASASQEIGTKATISDWPEDWKSMKLVCHFLAAIKSQLEGAGKKLPKGMEETVEVLGGLGELFLPAAAFDVLTTPPVVPPLPPLPVQPSKRFLDMAKRLPNKPAKKPLLVALAKKSLLPLGDVLNIITSFGVKVEVRDRSVRGLLDLMAKQKVLDPADVADYLVLITVQLKTAELNHPLVFAKQMAEEHAELDQVGEVKLKRRSAAQPVLPPQPSSLNLRVFGALFCLLAELPEEPRDEDAEDGLGGDSAALCVAAGRDLAETQLSGHRTRALSSGLVSLGLVARALSRDALLPTELRQLGATIIRRLKAPSFRPMDPQELTSAFHRLAAILPLSAAQWKELLGKLKEMGWLSSAGQDMLVEVVGWRGGPLSAALGWLVELVEVEGEWGELGRREELSPESVMGEPPRSGRVSEVEEGETGLALSVVAEYVVAARTEGLERGREGREEREEELRQRRLTLEQLAPQAALLPITWETLAAGIFIQQGAESSRKLAALLGWLFPKVRLTREQLLPLLLRLKAQRRLNLLQFSTLLTKSPYPVLPFPVLTTILDKVLGWNLSPPTNQRPN